MRAGPAIASLLVVSMALTSLAAAGADAKKQRVVVNVKVLEEEFVLLPLTLGALKRDKGAFSGNWRTRPSHEILRKGQRIGIASNIWTLEGARGTLTLRERIEWRDVGSDSNGDGWDDGIAVGTWKVIRATGSYAGVAGSGGSAHLGLGRPWNARFEGLLTAR